uniref:Uncharacterized protein n=1 Tax=Anguilla anguilla TaxID=7936 RepID=A0A0E9U6S9_ANGAN
MIIICCSLRLVSNSLPMAIFFKCFQLLWVETHRIIYFSEIYYKMDTTCRHIVTAGYY